MNSCCRPNTGPTLVFPKNDACRQKSARFFFESHRLIFSRCPAPSWQEMHSVFTPRKILVDHTAISSQVSSDLKSARFFFESHRLIFSRCPAPSWQEMHSVFTPRKILVDHTAISSQVSS